MFPKIGIIELTVCEIMQKTFPINLSKCKMFPKIGIIELTVREIMQKTFPNWICKFIKMETFSHSWDNKFNNV